MNSIIKLINIKHIINKYYNKINDLMKVCKKGKYQYINNKKDYL